MKVVVASALMILGCNGAARAEADCKLSHNYVMLAQQRIANTDNVAAEKLLRQAIEACPSSYEAYQTLGELQSQSPARTDQARAVDAFVSAHELAPSNQARARTLYGYASLLSRDGDPQNAYPLIRDAQNDDPGNPDIAKLSSQIERQVRNPTQEHIVRGLWNSLYKPLRSPSSAMPEAVATTAVYGGPSINIPIDFQPGTVIVDHPTQDNVVLLAHALADPAHMQQRFLFVGHTDSSGEESKNPDLSQQRAEAIYQRVISLEPALQGRIEVIGRGSSEPIDPTGDPGADGSNRRLQVLLQ